MAAATPAEAPAAAAPKKGALLIPIFGAALLSAALSGAAVFFLAPKPAAAPAHEQSAEAGAEAAAEAHGEAAAEGHEAGDKDGKKGAANYLPLTPAFVVNINDGDASHFLQVEIELSARSAAVVDALKLHNAQIRNALLMLLGAQSSADVASREGKEALQKKVLEEVQRILTKETGKPGVDAVYFTSFVMQ
ncbi:flagellar basal body-associated protein FliL [uncultured Nevskia sp.]|uniref:flagellar basal body-associated FliL family protein n=1 Tax=uncultured Nevskia sp. TaxID=228950 RepID=UPI0025E4BDEE|nr:flagellar basal body-associated FliL family protein [uncultured Nevskia sp.]